MRETALLARQTATLDQLSEGRLPLGLGLGGRSDDYAAVGVELTGCGGWLDEQVESCAAPGVSLSPPGRDPSDRVLRYREGRNSCSEPSLCGPGAGGTAGRAYYDFLDHPRHVVDALLTTPTAIRSATTAFGDLGADEVILYC